MAKVLCVDDSSLVRGLVRSILGKDGLDVIVAASGAEALALIAQERPDLVLLDIDMPAMDGLETLRQIAERPALRAIPIMMLTVSSDPADVKSALALGARDYLVKPFEPQSLRTRVRRLLESPRRAGPAASDPGRQRFTAPPSLRLAKKVLIVDDQPTILAMAQEILGDRFDVSIARDSASAVALAVKERPDLVLLDLYMPVTDGVETLRRLRQIPELAATRVLAMALGAPEEQAVLDEFDGTIRKPPERSQLLQVANDVLGLQGLFSFMVRGQAVVLRLHKHPNWDTATLDDLEQQAERAFAQMIETGLSWFVVDAEQAAELRDQQLEAALQAIRTALRRAGECRLDCMLVVGPDPQGSFRRIRQELDVELCRKLDDALRNLARRATRQTSWGRRPT